ncbi:MAG: hypothetical protein IPM66_16765 [Acidobacteriota bacterium]|nr:MAG: hypothetical protein IPM66_16765 [Acidobacteriota bacterium]
MGLPEIFSTAKTDDFEQTLMMTTFELTSWLVAFIAVMTIVVTAVGIFYLMKSESSMMKRGRGHLIRREPPAKRGSAREFELGSRTVFNK